MSRSIEVGHRHSEYKQYRTDETRHDSYRVQRPHILDVRGIIQHGGRHCSIPRLDGVIYTAGIAYKTFQQVG